MTQIDLVLVVSVATTHFNNALVSGGSEQRVRHGQTLFRTRHVEIDLLRLPAHDQPHFLARLGRRLAERLANRHVGLAVEDGVVDLKNHAIRNLQPITSLGQPNTYN